MNVPQQYPICVYSTIKLGGGGASGFIANMDGDDNDDGDEMPNSIWQSGGCARVWGMVSAGFLGSKLWEGTF